MTKGKSNALPSLAFGQKGAIEHADAKEFGDLIESSFPGLNAYDPLGDRRSFRTKTVAIPLETSKIVATAISPTIVDRNSNPSLTFILPHAGNDETSSQINSEVLQWGRNRGVFLPSTDERVIGTGGFRSHIMWQVQRDRLLATAQTMLPQEAPVDLDLDHSRLLPLEVAGVRTEASWKAILPILELHREHPHILVQLGIEDMLYRHTVMLLRPDLFSVASEAGSKSGKKQHDGLLLDKLCQYIVEHLDKAWTLTELERISGISARSLQMAFNARFGKPPMNWIKEERLNKVRKALLLHPEAPIDAVALSAGFRTMPSFFKAYKELFGETPGQTKSTTPQKKAVTPRTR